MCPQDMPIDAGESKARKRKSTRDSDLWYKRYPARFRRDTMHDHPMSFELRGAWSLLTDLFYEHGGPLPNDDRWIAIQLGCDVRKWKHIRHQLFEVGKLTVGVDGLVHNKTADEVLGERKVKLGTSEPEPPKRRLAKASTPATTSPSTPATTEAGSGVGSGVDLSRIANDIKAGMQKDAGDTRATKSLEVREEKNSTAPTGAGVAVATSPDLDALQAFQDFNEVAQRVGIPVAHTLTPSRRKSLKARLREHGGMTAWRRALANIEASAYLRGRNDRGWTADFDFLIRASKFPKVLEGSYGNGAHADPAATTNVASLPAWRQDQRRRLAEARAANSKPLEVAS